MTTHKQSGATKLVPEITMTRQFLPACGACGAAHPAARRHQPADLTVCPDCGAQVAAPPPPQEVKAAITGFGPLAILARVFLWVGEKLRNIAKGL